MNQKTKTFFALAAVTTTSLHILNKIQFSLSTGKNLLFKNENHYYDWRFGKIHYTKSGKGNPVLLIHNLTVGSSEYEFRKIVSELEDEYEVYTLDLLGYGLSEKTNMTYTNFLYVQLITDFIKNVIGKKTNIITSGDSSSIAIMATHNDPDIINNLIFINPESLYSCNMIPSKQTKAFKFLIEMPIIGTFIFNTLTTKESFKRTFETKYFTNSGKIEEQDILTYLEASHKNGYGSKYSFASHIAHYMNANFIHALKEINNSILILGGENAEDIDTTLENYCYYNSAIETAYVDNTKLLPHMECPEEVISQIKTFLN